MKIPPRLADQLASNQQRQEQIIKQRQEPRSLSASSLGDRSRDTGLYSIPDPRGGDPKPGVKINNAEIKPGDIYRIHDDGIRLVADGPNAATEEAKTVKPPGSLESRATRRNQCGGYLRAGQIFNCPEEEGLPRGLIILTHTLFHLDTSTEGNPSPFPGANIFAGTLFDYFSNDAGAIVYTPFNVDADTYLSQNHTWLNPADVTELTDIPSNAVIHYPLTPDLTPDERDFLLDYAKNKGAVVLALTYIENDGDVATNANLAFDALGFGSSIEARRAMEGTIENVVLLASFCDGGNSYPVVNGDRCCVGMVRSDLPKESKGDRGIVLVDIDDEAKLVHELILTDPLTVTVSVAITILTTREEHPMTTTAVPTKEQFQSKIAELRAKRLDLIHEVGKDATEEWFIQEELEDVEVKIRRYTKRMIELYGE